MTHATVFNVVLRFPEIKPKKLNFWVVWQNSQKEKHYLKIIWRIRVFFMWKRQAPKFAFLQLWPSVSPWRWPKLIKYIHLPGKTSAIGLSKNVKIKVLYPLPFSGKIWLFFALFRLFLAGNRVRSHVKISESKFDISYFTHPILGQVPVKSFWCSTFQ